MKKNIVGIAAAPRTRRELAEIEELGGDAVDPDAQCREHGSARWRCDTEHTVTSPPWSAGEDARVASCPRLAP